MQLAEGRYSGADDASNTAGCQSYVNVVMTQAESVAIVESVAKIESVACDDDDDEEEDEDECNNYDISELCSDDSTDDELEPKKKLPAWANG